MKKQVVEGEKHLTASAIIVSKESPKRVLMIHHKKIGKWFQPGGHVEQFENPLEAIVREVKEETGLGVSFFLDRVISMQASSVLPTPDFFLEEVIPAHKDEPMHYHLDAIYVIEVSHQKPQIQIEEAHDIGWFTLEEALHLPLYDNTAMMLQKVLQ